jgi:hypothetical protein
VGDLNGDGSDELIVQTGEDTTSISQARSRITAFRGNGTTMPGFPATIVSGTPVAGWINLGLADYTGDGRPEIVSCTPILGTVINGPAFSTRCAVLNGNGSFLSANWPRDIGIYATGMHGPWIADLDGDLSLEIVLFDPDLNRIQGTPDFSELVASKVIVVGATGERLSKLEKHLNLTAAAWGRGMLLDTNGDRRIEFVSSQGLQNVFLFQPPFTTFTLGGVERTTLTPEGKSFGRIEWNGVGGGPRLLGNYRMR